MLDLALSAGEISRIVLWTILWSSSPLLPTGVFLLLIVIGTNNAELTADGTLVGTARTERISEPARARDGTGVGTNARKPISLEVRVSGPGVGRSYRAHLDFVPDVLRFDNAYDLQQCFQQLEMVAGSCVACIAALEGRMSL